ncbi:hypothetical protein BIU82_12230 [Arthrobacter sp. SW1]|nr:hypothetical protein BIU82_12230 [Arthrobacter sp. SW1]
MSHRLLFQDQPSGPGHGVFEVVRPGFPMRAWGQLGPLAAEGGLRGGVCCGVGVAGVALGVGLGFLCVPALWGLLYVLWCGQRTQSRPRNGNGFGCVAWVGAFAWRSLGRGSLARYAKPKRGHLPGAAL